MAGPGHIAPRKWDLVYFRWGRNGRPRSDRPQKVGLRNFVGLSFFLGGGEMAGPGQIAPRKWDLETLLDFVYFRWGRNGRPRSDRPQKVGLRNFVGLSLF